MYPSLFIRYELFMMSFQIMFKTECSHQSAHPAQALLRVVRKKKGQALVKGVLI